VGNGKLEVHFDPFPANLFPEDYWVLWVNENYQRSIVGTPDRNYLWILSKDPADILSDFTEPLQMIKAQGFEIKKLLENLKRLAPNSRPTLLVRE
jgi:apolipoprotein D and lipocalin family protein